MHKLDRNAGVVLSIGLNKIYNKVVFLDVTNVTTDKSLRKPFCGTHYTVGPFGIYF
jgi:hypothetical protein